VLDVHLDNAYIMGMDVNNSTQGRDMKPMKKVLDGKRFDTEKAVFIGNADNLNKGVSSCSDFNYWDADLYVTPKSKQYFLHGEGGPMTRWSKPAGNNSWSGGEDILPMSKEEAFEWAQEYLDVALVERYFSDLIQEA
jgi:hypothetical protein